MKSFISTVLGFLALLVSSVVFAQDATAPGPFSVLTASYDRGDTACSAALGCGPLSNEIRAEVYYPSNLAAGPFPLIMFLHGRHSSCYDPASGISTGGWPCPSGFVPIPSYRGYDYIGRVLASHGYIVASVSANGINGQDGGSADQGIVDRADLLDAHLRIWNQFNSTGSALDPAPFASSFIGHVDLKRVGTMGHSRGGDGVVKHFALFNTSPSYTVRAVLPIAPTNFSGQVINNVNLGVLLGYCDGDVFTLEGSLFYDRARYAVANDQSSKYTFLSQGANHNFFNSVWTPDCWTNPGSCWADNRGTIPTPATSDDTFFTFPSSDPFCGPSVAGNGRLSSAQQRAVGLAYVAAFFRFHIGGETGFGPMLRGDVVPPASVDPHVYVGYHPPAARRVDLNRFNDATEFLQTTLAGTGGVRGAVTPMSLETFLRCGFDHGHPCFPGFEREVHLTNFSFLDPGLSRARLNWNAPTDSLTNALPAGARNVSNFDAVQFRVALDFLDGNNPKTSPTAFTVALADGATTANVSTNSQLGNNDLYFPPGFTTGPPNTNTATSVMSTLRLPLSQFSGVNLSDLRSVAFRFNGTPTGTVLVSDLAFVDDVAVAPRCESSLSFTVSDRASVTTPGGGFALANAGTGQTLIGHDAATNGVISVGQVLLLDRAHVTGDVDSGAAITAPTGSITGVKTAFDTITLPALPTLPAFPAPVGPNLAVNSGTSLNLAPGSYPSVTVSSGATLRLAAGSYFFQNLTINSSARVEVTAATRVLVKTSLAVRSSFVNAASAVQPIFLGFAGTADLTLEARFDGTLVAPSAHVFFGTDTTLTFTGSFFGRILEVRPGSALVCVEGPA